MFDKYLFYFAAFIKYFFIACGLYVIYEGSKIEGRYFQVDKLMLGIPLLLAFVFWMCHIAIGKIKYQKTTVMTKQP